MARLIALCWCGFVLVTALTTPASAQQTESFQSFLQGVADEAVQSGLSPDVVNGALGNLDVDERVLDLDQAQPEHTASFARYSQQVLSVKRIKTGRAFLKQNAELLREVHARYGVSPAVLVALLGIESDFGRHFGTFSVIRSLATLAYEGRRSALFRAELMAALALLQHDGIQPAHLKGSWAGAMGQCQFMPSTYSKHAVDYDGDGHRDIWRDKADVFASMSNYLLAEGWKAGEGWGREVRLSKAMPKELVGADVSPHPLSFWAAHGVKALGGKPLPKAAVTASLIQPDGGHGRSFLVYSNFRALMRWNRSTYFAASVGLLADRLR